MENVGRLSQSLVETSADGNKLTELFNTPQYLIFH